MKNAITKEHKIKISELTKTQQLLFSARFYTHIEQLGERPSEKAMDKIIEGVKKLKL